MALKMVHTAQTPLLHKHLSGDERRLVTSLAKVIHIWWDDCSASEKQEIEPPGYVYHYHDSTFERSGEILWRLGLANAGWHSHSLFDVSYDQYVSNYASIQDLPFPVVFKPISKNKIDEKISFHNFYPRLSIYDIIGSFLELASDYGGTLSVNRQSSFRAPHPDLAQALNVLVEFGYADMTSSDYVWTDKIAAPMISDCYWTEDDFDPASVNLVLVEEVFSQIEKMGMRNIPRAVPDGYLGKHTNNVIGFTFGLLRHWSGAGWTKEPIPIPGMTMDTAIAISRKVLGKYMHNNDYRNHEWIKL